MKNPGYYWLSFALLSMTSSLVAQEAYWLKIQPKVGSEFRVQSTVKISLNNGGADPLMVTEVTQSSTAQVSEISAQEVVLIERVQRIQGSSKTMGRQLDFDTSNPNSGNPTMNAQMELLVNKDMVSRIKPDGSFISGTSIEGLMGQNNSVEFRSVTGNVRFPGHALKIGDSWVATDSVRTQGMLNVTNVTWTLKEVKEGLAILSATGTGQISGSPSQLPQGKVKGSMNIIGSATVELHTGMSREATQKIIARMEIDLGGEKQDITSVTEAVARQIN